ncbi:MAG: hypothetical protein V2I40_13740 [Desulfobacteraceae bacterium]|jgi:hypothetical protein|nr:hypothetical protein [Desulfobacteraceae bacterium]
MIIWGNRRRLCFSGWILAALLLIGLNGFHLIALENQPLVGHSPTIKALRLNLSHYENTLSAPALSTDATRLRPLLIRYAKPPTPAPPTSAPPPDIAAPVAAPEQINLPVLAGIVQALDQQGRQSYWALLDGRVCRSGDKLGAFVIDRISPRGVVLNRSGRQWLIEAPAPHYSQDQGN